MHNSVYQVPAPHGTIAHLQSTARYVAALQSAFIHCLAV